MTMEPARIAPAPHPASAPQPAQPSSGKTFDKAAAGTPTQAGAQGAGSFAALLLALDGAAAQPTDTPAFGQDALGGIAANSASAPDDGALDVAVAMADPAALAAWQGALSGQHVQGTAQGTAGGAAGDGTNGTAKEGLLAGVGRGMAFDAPATIAQPHGLVAQTAQLDRAADATDLQGFQGQQGPQAAQALRRTLARSAAQAQAGLADSAAAQAAAIPGATAVQGGHNGADVLYAGQQVALTDAASASTRGGADAAPRSDPPSATLQATPATAQTAARDALIAAASAATAGTAGDGLRAKGRAGDGGAASPVVPAAGGSTFASTLQQAAGSIDASAVLADPAQAGAEDRLAQQISYWVHQTTQNAEMTVDQGGAAVQVSVSLTGNEARVHFMTDQAQARALLDANMAQLRELLQGQGLVLTGTSVGTTAQGQGQAGGGQAQEPSTPGRPGRAQRVVVTAPAGAGGGLRAGVDLRRALDVFA
jgi:flagellar hook-length control protein FliK